MKKKSTLFTLTTIGLLATLIITRPAALYLKTGEFSFSQDTIDNAASESALENNIKWASIFTFPGMASEEGKLRALNCAITVGNLEIADKLSSKIKELNKKSFCDTYFAWQKFNALEISVVLGEGAITEMLLKKGAQLAETDEHGESSLDMLANAIDHDSETPQKPNRVSHIDRLWTAVSLMEEFKGSGSTSSNRVIPLAAKFFYRNHSEFPKKPLEKDKSFISVINKYTSHGVPLSKEHGGDLFTKAVRAADFEVVDFLLEKGWKPDSYIGPMALESTLIKEYFSAKNIPLDYSSVFTLIPNITAEQRQALEGLSDAEFIKSVAPKGSTLRNSPLAQMASAGWLNMLVRAQALDIYLWGNENSFCTYLELAASGSDDTSVNKADSLSTAQWLMDKKKTLFPSAHCRNLAFSARERSEQVRQQLQ